MPLYAAKSIAAGAPENFCLRSSASLSAIFRRFSSCLPSSLVTFASRAERFTLRLGAALAARAAARVVARASMAAFMSGAASGSGRAASSLAIRLVLPETQLFCVPRWLAGSLASLVAHELASVLRPLALCRKKE